MFCCCFCCVAVVFSCFGLGFLTHLIVVCFSVLKQRTALGRTDQRKQVHCMCLEDVQPPMMQPGKNVRIELRRMKVSREFRLGAVHQAFNMWGPCRSRCSSLDTWLAFSEAFWVVLRSCQSCVLSVCPHSTHLVLYTFMHCSGGRI